ncbi:MAG: hypothetical protein JW904_05185 [Spirochaetales bacterium]|nr:hypothetical protein [Spirochaetales bacterium]
MTTKEEVKKMLDNLPDNVSVEDIMYELYFKQKVDRGLKDYAAGNYVSHEDILKEAHQWLKQK